MSDAVAPVLAQHACQQLDEFATAYAKLSPRDRITKLAEIQKTVRNLGKRVSKDYQGPGQGAKARIEAYLRANSGKVIDGEELAIVAGISEYGRRIRELRAAGMNIVSGSDGNRSGR